ncbi:hypothetical protein AB1Y20_009948 [Prymnesium parvum]|uniref:Bestrophin homolog n=1 Tax=Prymnesium parvum TaxID=97485 RepID=A0AB34K7F8_PRYPA|mmetsp:Transcript_34910/g.86825  ORF Transcript_34910/g.86825 Transcript_34910/m.86825 type:complete len:400 (-) Transcript_34910:265-1464(-)
MSLLVAVHLAPALALRPPATSPFELPCAASPRNSFAIGACRSGCIVSKFSPAYDSTVRYAAADWAKNMRTLPTSLVLKRISSPLLFNLCITSIVCTCHKTIGPLPQLVALPHTLLGNALGLLLVFRTNAAYDRFWEARKRWAIVTSEARALASLACIFMRPEQALPMLSLIAAFPVVLKNYLRGGSKKAQARDARRLKALLAREENEALSAVVNQPQFVLARLRQLAYASSVAGVTEKEREMLLKSTCVLGDCVSACERIYNSPIPLAYSRHTSRFLVLYVSTLPLTLITSLGWATVPAMVTICWALFGIFEIGNLIEEPFTAVLGRDHRPLLPLTELCRTIRRDVRAIAQYSRLASSYGAPTIERKPTINENFPESFTQLRELVTNSSSDASGTASGF